MISRLTFFIAGLLFLSACSNGDAPRDASGVFEAEETLISAEASGVLLSFTVEEGQALEAGAMVGQVDTVQLSLKKQQLTAQIRALLGRKPDVSVQLAGLQTQLENAEREKRRIQNLIQGAAATSKQLDDIQAQIDVLKKQIEAQKSQLEITSGGLDKDTAPLRYQVLQLDDQLRRSRLTNPVTGTVLAKYVRPFELVAPGKPLYKIADLSHLTLRVFAQGNQLSRIRIGDVVTLRTDNGEGGFFSTSGTVTWISDKAEFTPKTVQTKDERANLVYAVKIRVPNPEGRFKIGMYGEVTWSSDEPSH
jgi:HlyD family secretion protein